MFLNDPILYEVIPTGPADRSWIRQLISSRWGAPEVVVHRMVYLPELMTGFKAVVAGNKVVGLVTYQLTERECEVITLDSLQPGCGIGSALLVAVENTARQAGCLTCWLVTTNDNLSALDFYQKRGYRLAAITPGAVSEARKLKPSIPFVGEGGTPITDEYILIKTLSRESAL